MIYTAVIFSAIINVMNELSVWIVTEIEKRGWSQRELARRAGVSQAQVNNVINEAANAGADFCVSVARALDHSPEEIMRLAGILPPRPERDRYLEAMESIWGRLPNERKGDLVLIARAYIEEYDRRMAEREARRAGEPVKNETP